MPARLLACCLLLLAGCAVSTRGSNMRDACYNACASQKDECMLRATNAQAVQRCDLEGTNCSRTCR